MKKRKKLVVAIMLATFCMLVACGNPKTATFSGSKTGNQDNFQITFEVLNTTYTHDFEMKEGESIHVQMKKDAGEIKVVIQEGKEDPIYEGNGEVATDFKVDIPKDGTYTVSVTGKEAKGQVIFNRE